MPCYKLAVRFGRDDMVKRFLASGRSGFYLSVLSEGDVAAGGRCASSSPSDPGDSLSSSSLCGRPKECAGVTLATDRKRVVAVVGGLIGAAGLLALALFLGNWAYHYRRLSLHESRLQRLMQQRPTGDLVSEALAREGHRLLAKPRTPAELENLLRLGPGGRAPEILAKQARSSETHVYLVGDVIYFVYFGPDGVMRDHVAISKP